MQPRADLLSLGQAIKRSRGKKRWTRTALASHAGLSDQTIMRAELGRIAITVDHLWDIANALGVPLSQLFSETELDPNSEP